MESGGSSRRVFMPGVGVSDVAVVPGGIVVLSGEQAWIYDDPDSRDPRATFDIGGIVAVVDDDLVWTIDLAGVLHRIDPRDDSVTSFPLSGVAQTQLSERRRWFQRILPIERGIWVNGRGTESYIIDRDTGDVVEEVAVGSPGADDGAHIIRGRETTVGFGSVFSTGEDGTVRYDLATGVTSTHPWVDVVLSPDSIWSRSDGGLLRIDPFTFETTDVVNLRSGATTRLAYAHGAMWATDQGQNVATRITWTSAS